MIKKVLKSVNSLKIGDIFFYPTIGTFRKIAKDNFMNCEWLSSEPEWCYEVKSGTNCNWNPNTSVEVLEKRVIIRI